MPKYDVKTTIKVNGKLHKPGGDPLELDAKTAAPLVASGSLMEANSEPKKTETKAATKK